MRDDTFYDYRRFADDRTEGIFTSWDVKRGNHHFVIKTCSGLQEGETVLDVGCGLCHLYELLDVKEYVGIDIDPRIIKWARKRHPDLILGVGSVYDLSIWGIYDTVYAIGLYRRLENLMGIEEMLKHTRKALIFTIWQSKENPVFPHPLWAVLRDERVKSVEFIGNRVIGTDIIKINLKQ